MAIVLAFLLGTVLFWCQQLIPDNIFFAIIGAGLLVAVIGFIDDRNHIPARIRISFHALAAAWALFWLGGLDVIEILGTPLQLGILGSLLALLFLVWMLNLYNFMDGIDGIASIEAVTVCLSFTLFYTFENSNSLLWVLPALLAVSAAGFLVLNFPPAKIFMGDAGSGFLGLILGIITLGASIEEPHLLWCWLILLGNFVVDATTTLIRRILNKEKIYEAHRNHAYQHAAQRYGSHKIVSLTVAVLNLVWLLPLSMLVFFHIIDGTFAILVAYAPLIMIALHFKAGVSDMNAYPEKPLRPI